MSDMSSKKSYASPELIVHGTIEETTRWIGGPWGEFLAGEGDGWNPWQGDGPFAGS